jgi:Arc/MetJ family transcription regulator
MGVRTNIVIDEKLMAEAMVRTGLRTKRAVVEEALHCLLRAKGQQDLRELRGRVHWEGDLDKMRQNRHPEWS